MSSEPVYAVVSPLGDEVRPGASDADGKVGARRGAKKVSSSAPLAALRAGTKIGLLWTNFRNGNVLLEAFADLLGKRHPGLAFVRLPSGRTLRWGDYPDDSLGALAREQRIDAAIVAAGC